MPVTKKDQERIAHAWMYGQQARKDGKERAVPECWAIMQLQGFGGVSLGSEPRSPVSESFEGELAESAVAHSSDH
ncbi:hypothetical protein EJ069_08235 [Mesorhizobium sp. M2A.F.Ca.ET.043.05.1.1]|uniref:hypothetical protein n=1 Tax=Mesorhizobium sp. M2A.F.Ca.ET.043.05.1.1 TaxID=2493671 RepID=UPI000F757636|nr:hypothetical protein [Mesorhizobium sp. M2A.F.Ca.ET.043.05.1.1]AZO14720.1 hypothetical protein EJ069_08235 [Mesorhizobium sp. M2A.F.Ca.ET.043.05.1.1]